VRPARAACALRVGPFPLAPFLPFVLVSPFEAVNRGGPKQRFLWCSLLRERIWRVVPGPAPISADSASSLAQSTGRRVNTVDSHAVSSANAEWTLGRLHKAARTSAYGRLRCKQRFAVNQVNAVDVRCRPSRQSSEDERKAAFLLGSPHDSGGGISISSSHWTVDLPQPARLAMFARRPVAAPSALSHVVAAAAGLSGTPASGRLDLAVPGQPRQPIAPPPEITICSQCEQGRRRPNSADSEMRLRPCLGLSILGATRRILLGRSLAGAGRPPLPLKAL